MSFKPEVSTDGGATYGQNGQAFETEEEARTMAADIYHRWLSATNFRVATSEDPVNSRLVDTDKGWVLERVEAGNAVETQG